MSLETPVSCNKLVYSHPLNLYKSFCNSKGNRIIFKILLRGSEISYEQFDREFSVKTTPLTGGGREVGQ
jgi:hypothetical protein